MARSRGSGRVRYRLQYRYTVRTRISTIITIGPSYTGLRGTQLTGSISYTLVTKNTEPGAAIAMAVDGSEPNSMLEVDGGTNERTKRSKKDGANSPSLGSAGSFEGSVRSQ
jgi:hypothetical protein